jgi:hypothetical protein
MDAKMTARAEELASYIAERWVLAGKPIIAPPSTDIYGNKIKLSDYLKSLTSEIANPLIEAYEKCNEEINWLLSLGRTINTLASDQRDYRKVIAKRCDLPITKNSHKALPLCLFTLPSEIVESKNTSYENKVSAMRLIQIPISREIVDKIIAEAIEWLDIPYHEGSKNRNALYQKGLAIEILTGRRIYSEVLALGHFETIDDKYIMFKGQAKGNQEKREKPYVIPFLGGSIEIANKIIKAKKEIDDYYQSREWFDISLYKNESDFIRKFRDNVKKQLTPFLNQLDKHFDIVRQKAMLQTTDKKWCMEPLSSHDLRRFYAFACWMIIEEKRGAFTEYATRALIHEKERKSGHVSYNTKTSESYDMFREALPGELD